MNKGPATSATAADQSTEGDLSAADENGDEDEDEENGDNRNSGEED